MYVITVPERHRRKDRPADNIVWHNRAQRIASAVKYVLRNAAPVQLLQVELVSRY